VGWILLGLAAEEAGESQLPQVINQIRYWATSSNTMLQLTAALSVSRIGLVALKETLQIAQLLLKSKHPIIREAIWTSLGLLYLSGSSYAERIVTTLDHWINQNEALTDIASEYYIDLLRGKFAISNDSEEKLLASEL